MKPSIPKGTRDFSPEQVAKRNYLFDTIKKVFTLYGFQPIETPTMENLSTLTGKYGEEGDQLLFKVLNSGDFLRGEKDLTNYKKLTTQIAEKGLRYDLTIPFARYVVMHQNDITFPFRRYQIQPVWRGDNPQHGRYREFYQCDADIVGSDSLLNEAELVQIYDEVFRQLGFQVLIKINNRKILQGLAEVVGLPDKMLDITIAIDKLDKIGEQGVKEELATKGIGETQFELIKQFFQTKFENLHTFFADSATGKQGIAEIQAVLDFLQATPLQNSLQIDLTLARGLNYYTGCIFEVKVATELNVKMGSIGGGGRYDDLTGTFGLKGISGVGISFGADRIYDVLQELNLFPTNATQGTQLILLCFDAAAQQYAMQETKKLRAAGIKTEVYADLAKVKKQLDYANKRQIPFVALIGSEEIAQNKMTLKDMQKGEQSKLSTEEIIGLLAK